MITDPYKNAQHTSRFIADIDENDYQLFKSYFPRRGTLQSYVNTITRDIIEHVKREGTLIPGDPDNDTFLRDELAVVRSTLRRRSDTRTSRRPTTLSATRAASALCEQPPRTSHNPTNISSEANKRVRRTKRQEQGS